MISRWLNTYISHLKKIIILVFFIFLPTLSFAEYFGFLDKVPETFEECRAEGGWIRDEGIKGTSCYMSVDYGPLYKRIRERIIELCAETGGQIVENRYKEKVCDMGEGRQYDDIRGMVNKVGERYTLGCYFAGECSFYIIKPLDISPTEYALKFIPMLSDDSSETRNKAIEEINSAGRDITDIIPQVLPLLDSPRPEVQVAALKVLAEINDENLPKYVSPLLRSENEEVRFVAQNIVTMYSFKNPKAKEMHKYVIMLSDDNSDFQYFAVEQLQKAAKDFPELVVLIFPLLDNPSPKVQINAMEVLAKFDDKRIPKKIRLKLDSPDASVRLAVFRTWKKIDDFDKFCALLNDNNEQIRLAAISLLGNNSEIPFSKSEKLLPYLVALLSSESDKETVRQIGYALIGVLGPAGTISRVAELLNSADSLTQENALYILKEHCHWYGDWSVEKAREQVEECKIEQVKKNYSQVKSPLELANQTVDVFQPKGGISSQIQYDSRGRVKRVRMSRPVWGHYLLWDSSWNRIILVFVIFAAFIFYLFKIGDRS